MRCVTECTRRAKSTKIRNLLQQNVHYTQGSRAHAFFQGEAFFNNYQDALKKASPWKKACAREPCIQLFMEFNSRTEVYVYLRIRCILYGIPDKMFDEKINVCRGRAECRGKQTLIFKSNILSVMVYRNQYWPKPSNPRIISVLYVSDYYKSSDFHLPCPHLPLKWFMFVEVWCGCVVQCFI
jgi:hypothetical protein